MDLPDSEIQHIDCVKYDGLKSDLFKSKKQLEHVSELLNETELNNVRLNEQIKLLKKEIRRSLD